MPNPTPPQRMHTWRRRPLYRRFVGGGLFVAAVLLGVVGQWMWTGALAFVGLTGSVVCLLGAGLALVFDYQGDVALDRDGLLLPDGQRLPLRRIRRCEPRPERGGTGELVLTLAFPDGQQVVPTGQPLSAVRVFAEAVEASRRSTAR